MHRIFIEGATWKRDSHGLFDSESHEVEKCDLTLNANYILGRSLSGQLRAFCQAESLPFDYIPLIKISNINSSNFFYNFIGKNIWELESCSISNVYKDPEEQVWKVVENMENEYKLKRGDIIRIGRIQLKIKDYQIESAESLEDRNPSPVEEIGRAHV